MTKEKGKRLVGYYICWGCHCNFPLFEGQRRRYCPDCELEKERMSGGKGGKKPARQPDLLARAQQLARDNENTEDSLVER